MPTRWVEPDVFLLHRGIYVYHAYRNGNYEDRLEYWFTTSPYEEDGFEFDVREIKISKHKLNTGDQKEILKLAIDEKLLELPEDECYNH